MKKQLALGILTAVILIAAPAFASDINREDRGGIKIGPVGQCFDARACAGYYGGYPGGYYSYGSVLPPRYYAGPSYNPDLDYY
jgi:hypothetical protein